MSAGQTALEWSGKEFGGLRLGNRLRTRRLIAMAARAADAPAGQVTKVFRSDAEREAAYRFLERGHCTEQAVSEGAALAAIERAQGEPYVFVPVDGTSLNLSDPVGKRRLGSVGSYRKGARGLKVMNAIAVGAGGTPLGLLAQTWWSRQVEAGRRRTRLTRSLVEKETHHWLTTIQTVEGRFRRAASHTRPWFQMDREADFREMLMAMAESESYITVRASRNRRVNDPDVHYVWQYLEARSPLGRYSLDVPPGPNRRPRCACMEVRACSVTLQLRDQRNNSSQPRSLVTLWAVLAREVGTIPSGEQPLQWLLLTNYPICSFYNACEVVFGYSQRWRVEDFHRTWKSHCGVEDTLLHNAEHVQTWATILASVAMRVENLKYLARNEPDQPASVALSQEEIDAVILLREPPGYSRGDVPPISEVVRWIADLGGYVGKSSGGPPGSIVIGRGLERVEVAVIALRHLANEIRNRKLG